MTEPRTAAGRALAKERDACLGVQCSHASDDAIIAIEAEARAAAPIDVERLADALQSAGIPWNTFPEGHTGNCVVTDHYRAGAKRIAAKYAAIDAQRERSEPITVKSIPGYGE